MNKPNSSSFNRRALIALLMVCSFVWLPVVGIALHFTDTASFQPVRHLLMTVHNLAATIFLISAALHVRLNWKPLLNYVKATTAKYGGFRFELGVAALIVMTTLALGVLHVFARGGV